MEGTIPSTSCQWHDELGHLVMILSCWALSSKTLTLQLLSVTLPTGDHIWWGKVFVKIQLEFLLLQLVSVACSTALPLVLLLCMSKQVSLPALQTTISLLKTAIRSPLRSLSSSSYGWTSPVSLLHLWEPAHQWSHVTDLLLVSFWFDNVCLLLETPKLDRVIYLWSNECRREGG